MEEDSFELLSEDAVDDEIDRTVDGDEKIIHLCERMIHPTKVLQFVIRK